MKSILLTTVLIVSTLSNKEAQAPLIPLHMVAPVYTDNEYHSQRQALLLHFKNHSYPIQLIAVTHSSLIVSYEKGIAVIGFDLAKGQPTSQLIIYEGQFADTISDSKRFEMKALQSAEKVYASSDISIAHNNDDQIYIGKLTEHLSSESVAARLVINEALMTTYDVTITE